METLWFHSEQNYRSIILDNLTKNIKNTLNKTKEISDLTWNTLIENLSNNIANEEKTIASSINGEYILSQIEAFERDNNYYDQWHSARIFLVEVFIGGLQKKLLIIKDLLKKDKNSNKKILNEYLEYLESHKILSTDWNKFIRVPKTHWVLNDHEWNTILLLDFIPWMTIFSFKVSSILPILYSILKKDIWEEKTVNLLWKSEQYNNLRTDKENKNALLKILQTFRFYNPWQFYNTHLSFYDKYSSSDAYKWTRAESQMAKIFDSLADEYNLGTLPNEHISLIKDSFIENIKILHKHNIYHNDMNQRNIILWEDWYIYIIDFDKAANSPKKTNLNMDPKYLPEYKWIFIEWDFKVINHFNSFEKKQAD